MSALVKHLMKEHQDILALLCELELIAKSDVATADAATTYFEQVRLKIVQLRELVEVAHHAAEEKVLFPALLSAGFVNQSGPHCTQFLQVRFDWDHVALAKQLAAVHGEPFERPIDSSFLSIPLEEHVAGAALSRAIERCTQTGEKNAIIRLVYEYVSLLRLHIRKEDECLFVLANQLLSAEKQDELLSKLIHG